MDKPKTFAEFETLLEAGDLEVMIADFDGPPEEGDILLLVQDYRRTYEEGEIYELRFPNPGLKGGRG